jgi:hydroxymethylglutaryl-CoA synthase
MVGITAYGGYVPLWRLSRNTIVKAWGTGRSDGERSVAGFDEDTVTMAIEAATDCLEEIKRESVDALYLASTSFPYREKQSAAMVSTVLDMRQDVITQDIANSLRGAALGMRDALNAVQSGAVQSALIVAADSRLGYPKTVDEQLFGDGAAALLIGSQDIIGEIEASYSYTNEMIDIWRTDKQKFVHSWEGRFVITHGYEECMKMAIQEVLKKSNLTPNDITRLAIYGPDSRSQQGLARSIGFDVQKQLQDDLLLKVGNTGTAMAMMSLVSALESAKPGDRILFACYGDGADAFVIKVTDAINKIKGRRGINDYIESKRELPGYGKYLLYREMIEQPEELFNIDSAATILWRGRNWVLRGYGSRCNRCGIVTFPGERVCYGCQAKDDFTEVRISDKKAKVFTYSVDHLAGSSAEPIIVQTVAESEEGGARIYALMTDCDPEEVRIDMPVEMTFRRIREARGYYNYYWKVRPLRK